MSRGKCSGCGLENASCQKIRTHVMGCPEYVALYQSRPEACLDPEDEMLAYAAWRDSPEGQAELAAAKDMKYQGYRDAAEERHARARKRWGGSDHEAVVGSADTSN